MAVTDGDVASAVADDEGRVPGLVGLARQPIQQIRTIGVERQRARAVVFEQEELIVAHQGRGTQRCSARTTIPRPSKGAIPLRKGVASGKARHRIGLVERGGDGQQACAS